MGYGDPQVYGHPTIVTPNINRLAAEGLRFTQWYSAFHVCSPSRASILTGRLPVRSGCAGADWLGGVFPYDAVGGLPLNETTLPSLLKQAGYSSGIIGKWHVGQRPEFLPTNRGFDYYYGIPFSVDMGDSYWDNNTQTPLPLLENTTIIEQPVNLATLSPRYIAKATAFMQSAAARNAPFFLYMAHNHVHVPMFCSQQFCNTSLRGPYGDNMAELDNEVGQLVDAIQALGADNNTLMIFTSDNGPWLIEGLNGGSAGLLRDGKTTTWEGGVRVPAIARWPGRIAPGRVTAELASTMDVFTTTLALAGVAPPADRVIDGRDLSKVLFDPEAPSPHDCLFHYKGTSNRAEGQTGLWAVRCGNYKAHFVTNTYLDPIPVVHNPPLIFNIPFDPSETYPLSNSTAEYKAALATIQAAIAIHEATCPECAPNQMALGGNTTFAVCCDPNSKEKYPQFPACTCNPENWNPYNETTIAAHGARLSQYANHAW